MTTETLGALRMRRDMLQHDLNAITRGDAGSITNAAETSFYKLRLAAVDSLLALRDLHCAKALA